MKSIDLLNYMPLIIITVALTLPLNPTCSQRSLYTDISQPIVLISRSPLSIARKLNSQLNQNQFPFQMKLFFVAVLALTASLSVAVRIQASGYSVVHPVRPAGHSHLVSSSSNNPFYSFKQPRGNPYYAPQSAKFVSGGPSLLSYGNFHHHQGYRGGAYGGGAGRYGGFSFGGIKQKTCGVPPTHCEKSPYRTLTGACNHLTNPGAGIAGTT